VADKASIAAAALILLDEQGLAELSMRHLATALGVKASAIYWHYPNKTALLAAVSDAILSDAPALPTGGWGLAVRSWMEQLRAVLLAHTDAAELVSAALASGLTTVDPTTAPRAVLQAAGWSELDARWSAAAMARFVLGHVAAEQARKRLIVAAVLPSNTDPLDTAGFRHGVRLLLAGTANVLP
jgi:AcrR family transcriptional regulator